MNQKVRKSYALTGFGIWSAAGENLKNTAEHFFNGTVLSQTLLDSQEKSYLKLNRNHPSLVKLDLSPDFFTPNLLALVAADEALSQAGIWPSDLKNLRVGVCLGSTVGGTNYNETFASEFYQGKFPDADDLKKYFKTNSAQFVSEFYNVNGPVLLVSNACTSGLDAIGIATSWLDDDLCDLVICGGTEAMIPRMYYGFKSLMLTSEETACKPFDKNRKGFALAEGAGIMILEKTSTTRKILSFIKGYGTASDAYNPTAPHPEGRGLNLAVKKALTDQSHIDFISSHGVGSEQSDLTEGKWIAKNLPDVPVVAFKGYTGHSVGAAGALSTIMTALCLMEQKLPKSKGFSEIDPEIGIVPTEKIQSGNFKKALVLSLGFGGINSALYLELP